jgi:predicted ATPase
MALGVALINVTGLASADVERAYVRARDVCEAAGDAEQLFVIEWGLWRVYNGRAEFSIARELAYRLLEQAEHVGDPSFLLQAHHAAWSTLNLMGETAAAREHVERGWSIYDPQAHGSHTFLFGGHDPGVCACSKAALLLWRLGHADQAQAWNVEGLALARKLSHPQILAHAFNWGAPVHQLRRDVVAVEAHVDAALALATAQALANYAAEARFLRGWVLAERGQLDEAVHTMRQALAARLVAGTRYLQPYFLGLLADAHRKTGEAEKALALLIDALDSAETSGEHWFDPELHRLKGELLLGMAKRGDAEACFRQAIVVAQAQSAKSWELRAASSLARLWRDQGRRREACDLLAPIYGWFTEGFDTADLKDARALLDGLA